jgi:acyl dehydratase
MSRVCGRRDRYDRYLEEFEVGDVYRHWPGRTITQSDDTLFAQLTMNQHPLHSDSAYAAGTQHGQRPGAGTLVFSLAVGMAVADISGKTIATWSMRASSTLARSGTATRSTLRRRCSTSDRAGAVPTAASSTSKHVSTTSRASR